MNYEEFLKRVHDKCDEVGECWEWRGAVRGRVPVVWDPERKSPQYVKRQIAERRGDLVPDLWCTSTCGNAMCVNPEHVKGRTRSSVAKKAAKKNGNGTRTDWVAAIARSHQKRSKVTPEMVDQIRSSNETSAEIARQMNLHRTTVGAIRRHETWRDYNNPFFALFA